MSKQKSNKKNEKKKNKKKLVPKLTKSKINPTFMEYFNKFRNKININQITPICINIGSFINDYSDDNVGITLLISCINILFEFTRKNKK